MDFKYFIIHFNFLFSIVQDRSHPAKWPRDAKSNERRVEHYLSAVNLGTESELLFDRLDNLNWKGIQPHRQTGTLFKRWKSI